MLTIGSLFSGIGGLERGLEMAGLGPVLWQVELDAYCRGVLERHWPDARRYTDVREVGAELAPVDLICGGSPCQDISVAGKGAGITGARSGLWSEFARIVGVLRPRYVVVENVPALLRRGLDRVLADLAEGGYDAVWFPLSAAVVGAPHRRERLFIVAHTDSPRQPQQEGSEQEQRRWAGDGGAAMAHTDGAGLAQRQGLSEDDGEELPAAERGDRRTSQSRIRDVDDGLSETLDDPWVAEWTGVSRTTDEKIPERVARLRALGNAVVPQCAEVVGHVVRGMAGLE